ARAQAGAQAARGLDQEAVARRVAVGIVHLLEAVEVDEQRREAVTAPARALDRLVERRPEARAVGQSGERVAVGERSDVLAREHLLRDVAPDPAVAEKAAVGGDPRLAAHGEIAHRAVRARAAELE